MSPLTLRLPAMKLLFLLLSSAAVSLAGRVPLFDGRSFRGWEGDTVKTWRIENGTLIGGSLEGTNETFLATPKRYRNFDLRLKFKVAGRVFNSGVQFRSERLDSPRNGMKGYQADIGGS